jgi:Mor family transcriptional regulator
MPRPKTNHTPNGIKAILKEYEEGATAKQLAKKYSVSTATIYNWKKNSKSVSETINGDLEQMDLKSEIYRLQSLCGKLALELYSVKNGLN